MIHWSSSRADKLFERLADVDGDTLFDGLAEVETDALVETLVDVEVDTVRLADRGRKRHAA